MEIRPSADIRNKYTEISRFCKDSGKPVFLTVNGKGDTVVMSIDEYAKQQEQIELLKTLAIAKNDIINGNLFSQEDAFAAIEAKIQQHKNTPKKQ